MADESLREICCERTYAIFGKVKLAVGHGCRLWRLGILGIGRTAHAAVLHTTVLGFFAATIIPCHILQLDLRLFKTMNRAMGGLAQAA